MSWKLPIHTDYMKAQMEHEDTRIYAEEIYRTVKKYKPDYEQALEIGAAWGVSALSIFLAGEGRLTSVDINPKVKAHDEVVALGFQSRWNFIHSWAKDFWENNTEEFDLVYIDGGHTYEFAHMDITEGWKVLKKGGLMICDDVVHPKNKEAEGSQPHYGVAIAVMEHIVANNITQIGTSSKLWWTIK